MESLVPFDEETVERSETGGDMNVSRPPRPRQARAPLLNEGGASVMDEHYRFN